MVWWLICFAPNQDIGRGDFRNRFYLLSDEFTARTFEEAEKIMRDIATTIKKPELVAKRREQIIRAAMDLFRKNGYQRTTVRQICSKSMVNRGSFYDYFQSKEDILVYIYKTMMYSGGDYDKDFRYVTINGWEDLETYIRSILSRSWNANKRIIQLLYRETISLDKITAQEVFRIEADYVKWMAENLRKGLGLKRVTRDLEILSNMMVFLNAFIPLRNWNMSQVRQEKILDFIIEILMMKLERLRAANIKGL